MRGSFQKHQALLNDLEQRVREHHPNANILKEWEYTCRVGNEILSGEVDLLVIYPSRMIFYEVKSANLYCKARRQYRRFKRAFGYQHVQGVYYSPHQIKRLR